MILPIRYTLMTFLTRYRPYRWILFLLTSDINKDRQLLVAAEFCPTTHLHILLHALNIYPSTGSQPITTCLPSLYLFKRTLQIGDQTMPYRKAGKRARSSAGNKAVGGSSNASTMVPRRKSQGNSGEKVSVTHQKVCDITLTRRHFVDLRMCMADFAEAIILKNENRHVKTLRIHVEWHWEGEVLKHFEDDSEWMHAFLLNQVSCNTA